MSEVSDLELKERFSIVPIMRAMHLDNVSEFARLANVTRRTAHRWLTVGIDVWTADELCCHVAQLHPYIVYGDDWFATVEHIAAA